MDNVNLEEFYGDGVDYSGNFVTLDIFGSDSAAIDWAKKIAIGIGFELIISSHKNKGKTKLLRCSRGERYRGVLTDLDDAARKDTKTKACKCPFQIKAEQLYDSSGWTIVPLSGSRGMHNHVFIKYPEGHRQMSGLSNSAKQVVREMSAAQARPCAILAAIQKKFPDDKPTRRHIYNHREYLRRHDSEERDIVGQFHHLAVTNNYVHWTQADPDTNKVTHVFMAHPTSINLIRTYRWFIGMDSTYKTNKYRMPLLEIVGMTPCNKNFLIAYAIMKDETEASHAWVLDKLKILLGFDVHLNTIVTDRELGLMGPIRDLFPESAHLLCTWHINKDVEDKVYRICGKNKEMGQRFKNRRWKKIMEASTEEEYNKAVQLMKDSWRGNPKVISYVENTWLKYKEMFVVAWTNKVLHFGNTTTCRVESAHAELKQWLNSSTGALDTVWVKVNNEIESQLTQIRYTLEQSRSRASVVNSGFSFNYLSCRVSHYCLRILSNELKRMRELSDQVYDRCGCALQTTHQIPCACELKRAMESQTPCSVKRLHIFWRTLLINEGADTSTFVDPSAVVESEDQRYFQSLVDEVKQRDLAVVRSISLIIHDHLHPDQSSFAEPDMKTTVKGRPRGSTSTKRDPSSWEYSQRGRGRARLSSSSCGRYRSSSASVHNASSSDGHRLVDISNYDHADKIPGIILPFVEGYLDVLGDGNCGFRVVADYIFGDQDQWRLVRVCVANEIMANRMLYRSIYFDGIELAVRRVSWDGGSCHSDHWMDVADDLFPIATIFNAVVMLFGFGNGRSLFSCLTVLPLKAPSTSTRPSREIVIAHLGDSYKHYIRLDLIRDFPVPPIVTNWFALRDNSVVGWEHLYSRRRDQWDRLVAS